MIHLSASAHHKVVLAETDVALCAFDSVESEKKLNPQVRGQEVEKKGGNVLDILESLI